MKPLWNAGSWKGDSDNSQYKHKKNKIVRLNGFKNEGIKGLLWVLGNIELNTSIPSTMMEVKMCCKTRASLL